MSEIIAAVIALLATGITGYLYSRLLKSRPSAANTEKEITTDISAKKEKKIEKHDIPPTYVKGVRFFIWGPKATGKTWFVNSFIRKINLIGDSLRHDDVGINMWVEDNFGQRIVRPSLAQTATEDIEYTEYTLHRVIPSLGIHEVHGILLLDGPGDETTGAIAIEADIEYNRVKVLAAHEALKDADCLLIAVNDGLGYSEKNKAGEYYLEMIQALRKLERKPNQRVILCFTKSDRFGGGLGGFNQALAFLFGELGKQIGSELLNLNPMDLNQPRYYFTSAVGYLRNPEDGKSRPNFNYEGLIDISSWNPHNVHQPIFDVLDSELRKFFLDKTKSSLLGNIPIIRNIQAASQLKKYQEISFSSMMEKIEI